VSTEPQWHKRRCQRCHRTKTRRYYPNGWSRICLKCRACEICGKPREIIKDRKTCSQECANELRRRLQTAHMAKWQPRKRKACLMCGAEKPNTGDYFYLYRTLASGRPYYDPLCKPCRRTEYRVRYRADPALREQAQASAERQRERIKQRMAEDPEYAEQMRVQWREANQRWRNGTTRKPDEGINGTDERAPRLPAKPLGQLLERIVMRVQARRVNGIEDTARVQKCRDDICAEYGTTGRTLYAWSHGEREMVDYGTADRVLTATGLNWWDVWDPTELQRDYPEIYERLEA
jgi:hypothetical protein